MHIKGTIILLQGGRIAIGMIYMLIILDKYGIPTKTTFGYPFCTMI